MAESIVGSIGPIRPTSVDEYVYNGTFTNAGSGWYASAGNVFDSNRFEFKSPTFGDLIGRLVIPISAGADYVLSFDVVANAGSATLIAVANLGETGGILGAIYNDVPTAGTITVPFTASGKYSHIRFNADASCIIDNISITVA